MTISSSQNSKTDDAKGDTSDRGNMAPSDREAQPRLVPVDAEDKSSIEGGTGASRSGGGQPKGESPSLLARMKDQRVGQDYNQLMQQQRKQTRL